MDGLFSRFVLADRADYGRFLSAQAAAFISTEGAIGRGPISALLPDWFERRRSQLLLADLGQLGLPMPPPLRAPALTSDAALLGAVYVLEGSRLGGAYLKRSLANELPQRFLAAPQEPGAWRNLLASLDQHLADAASLAGAAQTSVMIFQLFERAGRRQLEQRQAA